MSQLGRNVLIQLIASSLGGLISFVTISVSARVFGPAIFGQIAYLIGFLGIIMAVSDLGLSRAHVHFTAFLNQPRKTLGTFIFIKLVILGLCAVVALISGFLKSNLSWIFIILLANEIISRIAEATLITFEGLQQAWVPNISRLSAKAIKLLGLGIILLFFKNAFGYSLSILVETIILFGFSLYWLKRFYPLLFSLSLAKKYIHYSLPFALIIPLSYLQDSSLPLILRQFHSVEAVGFFAGAYGIFGFVKTLSGSLMTYFFPKISDLYRRGQITEIQRYTDLAVKFSIIFFTPFLLLLFLFRYQLITLVLGQQFLPSVPVFAWLLLGQLILIIFIPYDHVLFATRNHQPIIWVTFFSLILLMIFNYFLAPQYGAVGTAISLVFSWLIGSLGNFMILVRRTGIRFCTDFSFGKNEVKYFYALFYSFSQADFRHNREEIS